jgi:glycosyltransferase involved in cell wall biosynthesis
LLSEDDQQRVLQRVMLQFEGIIHIVESKMAWEALARNPKPFAKSGKVFVSLYQYERTEKGQAIGFVADGTFSEAMPGVRAVITDNFSTSANLDHFHGWPHVLTAIAPTPVTFKAVERKKDNVSRVVWAGELCYAKNPELLFETAKRSLELRAPFLFDVYGDSSDHHGLMALNKLRQLPNVKLHGSFEVSKLPWERFSIALITSEHEGFPLFALDAIATGLPVVALARGGLTATDPDHFPGDVITQARPEYLLASLQNVHMMGPPPAEVCKLFLEMKHSQRLFADRLKEHGYFGALCDPTT